ncbi:MAG: PASTA domain-containing protein [Bacteroidaceae bacterium]|nr:PASTA domain-containing protein [Bacteroidaceae bacterium]MCF0186564.1 PASTA domain-containing protein [Bacteroidaceae bacterium]
MNANKIKRGLKSYTFWMHFFAVTSFFLVMFFILQVGLRIYTRHGQGIEVPDVKGLLYSDAEFKLHEMNLEVLVIDSDYVKDMPAGCVVEQTPLGGLLVKSNRTVYLTVNAASSPTLVLPDLADNASKRQAMVKLQSMGLHIGNIETTDGEKDWVYAIKYRGRKIYAGDRVPSDAVVTLVVGNGFYTGDADSTLNFTVDDIGSYSPELDEEFSLDATEQSETKPQKKNTETKKKSDDWF